MSCRHVKSLESRSQLLDAALASADEANRRWEECRALVDQLRIENAALRAALAQAQAMNGQNANTNGNANGVQPHTNSLQEQHHIDDKKDGTADPVEAGGVATEKEDQKE